MANGKVVAICISPVAGGPMQLVNEVRAFEGMGLQGDRYCTGQGSFNKGNQGRRQVTFINGIFFKDTGFEYVDSRRNIVVEGVELIWLIGKYFSIDDAKFLGVKYCDPCDRPSKLSGKPGFKEAFYDRGGLVAEVFCTGLIRVGDEVIPPSKGY